MQRAMFLSDFDFALPDELIAQEPLARRDASRLLVLPRGGGPLSHRGVRDLPELLREGDLLVFNDARVIPARLHGHKRGSGGKVELLLVEPRPTRGGESGERWYCLGQASKGLKPGLVIDLPGELEAEVTAQDPDGGIEVRISKGGDALLEALWSVGEIPLPPYIRGGHVPAASDPNAARYQTILARRPGASAAPTAGLHFTPELFSALEARGIRRATVTLFVGPGTFLPVRTEDVSQHRMHAERFEIPAETVQAIRETRARGGRVIAVGTTSLRALEAAADGAGGVVPGNGSTDLFVTPGYSFRVIDGLMTNFHLPKSTLLMLVSALVGRERLLEAYAEAVRERYRFFSYGDAMLLT
ncbi:MAG: S-adenosylmethionine:tRNA ribosyltransferase-isomerase [Pseudomonadota bacterium]|jgi:S-adenosylmethionine:tRNA ribosyltransferase-isomerase